MPIKLADGSVVSEDGCIRPETTAEVLAGLAPAFDADGTVTAGTSSPLTDGASATLVCTEEYAAKHNLDVLARVKSIAVAGCAPEIMGYGPVPATQKALKRAGVKADQLDVIEINEAFASQAIVCIRDLASRREEDQSRRRRHRARPSARRHRRAHHRQGRVAAEAREGQIRALDAMHRRRPGHRDGAGARLKWRSPNAP